MTRKKEPPENIQLAMRLIAAAMRRNIERGLAIETESRLCIRTRKGVQNKWNRK